MTPNNTDKPKCPNCKEACLGPYFRSTGFFISTVEETGIRVPVKPEDYQWFCGSCEIRYDYSIIPLLARCDSCKKITAQSIVPNQKFELALNEVSRRALRLCFLFCKTCSVYTCIRSCTMKSTKNGKGFVADAAVGQSTSVEDMNAYVLTSIELVSLTPNKDAQKVDLNKDYSMPPKATDNPICPNCQIPCFGPYEYPKQETEIEYQCASCSVWYDSKGLPAIATCSTCGTKTARGGTPWRKPKNAEYCFLYCSYCTNYTCVRPCTVWYGKQKEGVRAQDVTLSATINQQMFYLVEVILPREVKKFDSSLVQKNLDELRNTQWPKRNLDEDWASLKPEDIIDASSWAPPLSAFPPGIASKARAEAYRKARTEAYTYSTAGVGYNYIPVNVSQEQTEREFINAQLEKKKLEAREKYQRLLSGYVTELKYSLRRYSISMSDSYGYSSFPTFEEVLTVFSGEELLLASMLDAQSNNPNYLYIEAESQVERRKITLDDDK